MTMTAIVKGPADYYPLVGQQQRATEGQPRDSSHLVSTIVSVSNAIVLLCVVTINAFVD